ncbi:MAG: ATP-binding protein [Candidatus Binatia bacterium]
MANQMSIFQQTVKVKIEQSLCIACGLCREVCPEKAVHPKMQDIHHRFEVLAHECTGCSDCLPYCPVPLALQEYEPEGSQSPAGLKSLIRR